MNAVGHVVARMLPELPLQDRTARFDGIGSAYIIVMQHERSGRYSAALYTPEARGGWVSMSAAKPAEQCAVTISQDRCSLWIGDAAFRLRDPRQARDAARFVGVEPNAVGGEASHVPQ